MRKAEVCGAKRPARNLGERLESLRGSREKEDYNSKNEGGEEQRWKTEGKKSLQMTHDTRMENGPKAQ